MERKDVIKAAEALNLNIKKNWKTTKIVAMVQEKLDSMNGVIKEGRGISPDLVILDDPAAREKVYCGKSPLTGEKIYK